MPGYNDSAAAYGSQKVTLTPPTGAPAGSTTGPLVAKDISIDNYDADIGVQKDEVGNEIGQWFMGKIPRGTCTLQFPTPTTPAPVQYSILPLKAVGATTATNYIIYKLGTKFEAGGETFMNVSIALQTQATGDAVVTG